MGWKKLPPIFYTVMDTLADLANAALHCNTPALPHRLDYMVEIIVREETPNLQTELAGLTRESYLRRANANPAAYVDSFANNFLGLSKGPTHRRRQVRKTLFRSLDKVFQACDSGDLANLKEVLSLKNLGQATLYGQPFRSSWGG